MIKNDLEQLTASEARVELASGRLTSQSLVAACLARIADRDQAVAAWAHIDADRALAAARASDALRSSGKSMPALSGIPVGIKDIIDTSDYPTELGSVVFAGRRPSAGPGRPAFDGRGPAAVAAACSGMVHRVAIRVCQVWR